MTALLGIFNFVKGLKVETIAFVLLVLLALSATGYAAWTKKSLKAAEADLVLEKHLRATAERKLIDAQEQFDKRLNDIKALETTRKTNRLEIQPFELRIEELTREDADAPKSSFVDRLNAVNADLNRMFEHNSR
jgi:hypothetical protein